MKRSLTFFLLLVLLAAPYKVLAFDPNYLLSDAELTDVFAMDFNAIQTFLERGTLATYKAPDAEGRIRYAADIIWRTAQNVGINPKFLLVLIQKEQSLVEDTSPTSKQYDWATGYGVCDDCDPDDPALDRWQGFGKQINSAALQFIDGYLADIESSGVTSGRYGPDVSVEIDDVLVTPVNAATAAMYAYTPHLHGNQNFVTIWDRWFGKEYPTGSLLQAAGEDGVWLIEYGYKRPIRSASALHSRFNADLIITVSGTDLTNYSEGRPIDFPNYTLVKDEDGGIYLLVDDALRHIESMEAFRSIGFTEDQIVDISNADRSLYTTGTPITTATQDPEGKLLQLKTNGAVFYVENGLRHAILDKAILTNRFPGARLTAIDPVVVEQYKESTPLKLPDGLLIKSDSSPAVYVLSEGKRLPILSESIFTQYGFSWDDILTVSDSVVNLHPLGEALGASTEE